MNLVDITSYQTLIFDCDGVILNSNKIKTEAFYEAALVYGKEKANQFVDYHRENGGISRYKKFQYFFEKIILKNNYNNELYDILNVYSNIVMDKLAKCEINPYLHKFKSFTKGARWGVVSGGNQDELRAIFNQRKLSELFELGIYGSPDTKEQIFSKIMRNNLYHNPALYFGDSKYDYEVTKIYGVDFLFISCWTEFSNWREFHKKEEFDYISNFNDLINN